MFGPVNANTIAGQRDWGQTMPSMRERKTETGGAWTSEGSARLSSPAVARNTAPIVERLRAIVDRTQRPPSSQARWRALELASGSGEHAVAFARAFPDIDWQPSEHDPAALRSIAAWGADADLPNLAPPLRIDLADPQWMAALDPPFDLIYACNLMHISPVAVSQNLLAGAARLLSDDGFLFVYGCFSRSGDFVSSSNERFDQALRARDPAWGVRDTDFVEETAAQYGLALSDVIAMPANNTVVVMRRDT